MTDEKSMTDKTSLKSTTISHHINGYGTKSNRESKKATKIDHVTQSVQFAYETDNVGKANSVYSLQLQSNLKDAVYENTYRMEPDPNYQFDASRIDSILNRLLEDYLKESTYDSEISRQMTIKLANKIMEKVKETNIQRYKLIVMVNIGDFKDRPSVHFASRCLWNKPTDTYSSASYTNLSLYAVAIVFGIYYE